MRPQLTRLLVPLVTACMGALLLPGAVSAAGTAGLTATEGTAFSGVVATFDPADVGASTCSEVVGPSVDWGDGSGLDSSVTIGGTAPSCTVSGTHTYTDEGLFSLVVFVAGPTTFTVYPGLANVMDADDLLAGPPSPIPLSPIEGASFSGLVATFGDAYPGNVASDFTATIDWGDGTTTAGTVTSPSAGLYDVSGSHTYAEDGPYSATVTLTDGGGPTNPPGIAPVTVEVSDAPLTAAGTTLSSTSGQPLSATVATFTDADPGGVASDYTATIAWGDGATSAGTISAGSGSGFDVSGTHTYSSPGAETATITIQDAGGSSTTASTAVTVAAAPVAPEIVLRLTKGVASSEAGPFSSSLTAPAGSTAWYQLTLTNAGTNGLVGLTLVDSAAGGGALPASCPALPSPFAAGATYTCTYSSAVAPGTATNTATAAFGATTVTASATVTGAAPALADLIAPGVDRGTSGFGTASVVLERPGYVTYLVRLDPSDAGQHVAIYTETARGAWRYTTGRIVAADGTVHYYARISGWTGFWAKLEGAASHGRIATVR